MVKKWLDLSWSAVGVVRNVAMRNDGRGRGVVAVSKLSKQLPLHPAALELRNSGYDQQISSFFRFICCRTRGSGAYGQKKVDQPRASQPVI